MKVPDVRRNLEKWSGVVAKKECSEGGVRVRVRVECKMQLESILE